jgi:crotonobetainyl-CoA:carnitine CoA-transferase CaiB-like acyl-CoA transferase
MSPSMLMMSPQALHGIALRQLAWAGFDPGAIDAVAVRSDGAGEALEPVLRADRRPGGETLWEVVAAEAVAGRAALLAAARRYAGMRGSHADPVDAAAVIAECFTRPLHWHGAARRPAVHRARDGAVALITPTPAHLELLAACIGAGAEPGEEATAAWIAARGAAQAEEELQACGVPALAVGTARGAPREPLQITETAAAAGPKTRAGATRPLEGVRVVELGGLWAAPFAARLLADLGAEVVKLELPGRPDGLRTGSPAHFAELNAGKRMLGLDLRSAAGVEQLLELLRPPAVVVENLSPRVLPNLGIPAATISSRTGASVVSLPVRRAVGGGPPPQRVALGSIIELAAGLGLPGPDGIPTCAPVPFTDALAGILTALAAVAALVHAPAVIAVAQVDDVAAALHPKTTGSAFGERNISP